jgi:hypothetical protein
MPVTDRRNGNVETAAAGHLDSPARAALPDRQTVSAVPLADVENHAAAPTQGWIGR